jgi:hypothetical protein
MGDFGSYTRRVRSADPAAIKVPRGFQAIVRRLQFVS